MTVERYILQPGATQPEAEHHQSNWCDWVVENVAKPMYNGAVVQTVDTASNLANGVTHSQIFGKLDRAQMSEPQSQTEEMVRTISGGIGSMVPYVLASKAAGAGLRAVGTRMELTGAAARLMASDTTALMLGGALVDGSRDVNPGETRLGNIGGGMVGLGVFGAGNKMFADWSVAGRALVAYPLVGMVGAEAQHATSQVLSGQKPTWDNDVALHGAAMNAVMPWVSVGLSRAMYAAQTRMGSSVSADRFAEHNGLNGRSPSLDEKVGEFPLARVKVNQDQNAGSSLDVRARTLNVAMSSDRAVVGERFGHELRHLGLEREMEPEYVAAARNLQAGNAQAARDGFMVARATQEHAAQWFGEKVRNEMNGVKDTPFAPKPMTEAHQKLFDQDWQKFKESNGTYRPTLDMQGKAEAQPARNADGAQRLEYAKSEQANQGGAKGEQASKGGAKGEQASKGGAKPNGGEAEAIGAKAKPGGAEATAEAASDGYKLVLGAGGAKAYYALGALMAAEKLHIPFSEFAGVSAGGDLAAGLANGLTARQLLKVTYDARTGAYDPTKLFTGMQIPTFGQLSLSNSMINLERLWEPEVRRLGWTWPDNLELIAARRVKPGEYETRVMTNKDATLAQGLAATGAHEAVFQPVKVGKEYLVDGGHAHMNPVVPNDTPDGKPAIVFRLNRVKEVPAHLNKPFWDPTAWIPESDGLPPIVKKMLIEKEMSTPVNAEVDPKHVTIDLDTKIAGLDFWVSKDEATEMVRDGFKQGFQQLRQAIADGRIVPSRTLTPTPKKPK